MYISYNIVNGIEYGTATSSVRNGKKVGKSGSVYLGRVIDKEKNIFKSREHGLCVYDIDTNSFLPVPPEYQQPEISRKTKFPPRKTLSLAFGDIFLLDTYLTKIGFYKVVDAIHFRNSDTIRALLCFYILSDVSNCYVETWWKLSYAKYLFPRAQLASQGISSALEDIGRKEAKRDFFKAYFDFLRHAECSVIQNGVENAILIESTGLPNAAQLPITAVRNHNGIISEEICLIYVIEQKTGLPLYYRCIAGNAVDVTTLTRTITELKSSGIDPRLTILDAGYYTGKNADALYEAEIPFLSRMKGDCKVYRKVIKNYLKTLDSKKNFITYHGRAMYVRHIPVMIGTNEDLPAHAYLCRDADMQHMLSKRVLQKACDQNIPDDKLYEELQSQGIFVLISSIELSREELLPLYCTRDQVGKIFNICKENGKILPLNIEKEETFRGHLMMTFMSKAIIKLLKDKIAGTSMTFEKLFMVLHEHRVSVYEDQNTLLTSEPVKEMNDGYKFFDIKCPETLPIKTS